MERERWRGRGGGEGESYYHLSQCLQQHGLMTELMRRLTGVGESFCELNFYIVVLFKCKKDRMFIIAYFMFLCPFLREYLQ